MKYNWLFVLLSTFLLSSLLQAQWIPQTVPNDVTMLLSTDFIDSDVGASSGYIFTDDFRGRAIYTTNCGANWLLAQVPDSARALVSLQFLDSQTAYIAGAYNISTPTQTEHCAGNFGNMKSPDLRSFPTIKSSLQRLGITEEGSYRGLFLKTTNAGQTWNQYGTLLDSVFYLIGMSFINSQLGFVTGDASLFGSAVILKTTNGGMTWIHSTIPDSIVHLRHITFIDSLHGFAAGYRYYPQTIGGVILETTDGGLTWMQHLFPMINNFSDIHFVDESTGYVTGFDTFFLRAAIYKTTNAGLNWLPLALTPDTAFLEGIRFAKNSTVGIVYGEKTSSDSSNPVTQPYIGRTTDEGASWTYQVVTGLPEGTSLIGGKLISDSVGYVSGGDVLTQATMLHTTNGGITFVKSPPNEIVQDYNLFHNYPNPFNPTTTIEYEIPRPEHIILKIFTPLGQEIATLVNELQSAGRRTVVWNGLGRDGVIVSSGLYVYRLQTETHIQSRKMILLR